MIRVLPAEVVHQIAAGEVVERPFSVVKELVENSLDAGCRRVQVDLVDGGRTLVRVTDDGGGMTREDLALLFVSHATSKLGTLADLEAIATLGFRGEALASIGSVSRARIVTRRPSELEGSELRCQGGELQPVMPAGSPPGTRVEIADLFFNTPARRRFLKSEAAEKARCLDLITRLALSRTDVEFLVTADGRYVLRAPAAPDLRARVGDLLGRDLALRSVTFQEERGGVRVHGLLVDPQLSRRDKSGEFWFVNGRAVRDNSLSHALRSAYREHLMDGTFPQAVVFLDCKPGQVDVNVHPTKSEVRFADASGAYTLVRAAVERALARHVGRSIAADGHAHSEPLARPAPIAGFPQLPAGLFGGERREKQRDFTDTGAAVLREAPVPGPAAASPFASKTVRFLQVANLYLVLETEAGITLVDQHALHERVLYEELCAAHAEGRVACQRLLVPETMELPPGDKQFLLESAEELEAAGFLVSDFGGAAVAIHGVPAPLQRTPPRRLLETFLQGVREPERKGLIREALLERFHSMACRAAVMAGDRLNEEEIRSLLERAARLRHPHNCPHGRPTVLTLTHAELERHFRRRV
jgi:DNA mismatch repair protein MutL